MDELVYLYDEGCYGILVERHAYHSIVRYAKDGIEYEGVQVDNDDYDFRTEGKELG